MRESRQELSACCHGVAVTALGSEGRPHIDPVRKPEKGKELERLKPRHVAALVVVVAAAAVTALESEDKPPLGRERQRQQCQTFERLKPRHVAALVVVVVAATAAVTALGLESRPRPHHTRGWRYP